MFFSEKYTFSQVPTLVETIETCLELGIKMFIEVKAYQHSVKVNMSCLFKSVIYDNELLTFLKQVFKQVLLIIF